MKTKISTTLILLIISVLTFGQFEKYNSIQEFDSIARIYYHNNDIDSAILSYEFALNKFHANEERTRSVLSFLYIRATDDSKAIDNWNKGHEKGCYFGLSQTQYFDHFKDNDEFTKTANVDKQIGQKLDSISHVEYEVSLPNDYQKENKYPVVFIFHGNARNLEKTQKTWDSDYLNNEFIVIYLQSYIHYNSYDFKWVLDDEKTLLELNHIYDTVLDNYSVDRKRIVFAGMSAGGSYAIDCALNNNLHCTDLIMNCPVVPDVEIGLIDDFVKQNKSIVIITGEEDFALNDQKDLIEKIKEKNGQAEIEIIEGMGHDFSDDFSSLLDEYFKIILEN